MAPSILTDRRFTRPASTSTPLCSTIILYDHSGLVSTDLFRNIFTEKAKVFKKRLTEIKFDANITILQDAGAF